MWTWSRLLLGKFGSDEFVLFCSAACENNCFRVVPELSSDSKMVLLNAREDFQGDGANEHYYILGVSKKCVLFYFVVLD